MNGYVAFYKGKRTEVYASCTFEARTAAAKQFKAKHAYDVTVMLAETDAAPGKPGTQVTHTATF